MDQMKAAFTDAAPKPGGHYSQAVIANGFVFVSGILGLPADATASAAPSRAASSGAAATGAARPARPTSFEDQAALCFANLRAVLAAAGSSMDRVVRTTVYIADVALWPDANRLYAVAFGPHRPARTIVPTGPLHYGLSIELDAIALAP